MDETTIPLLREEMTLLRLNRGTPAALGNLHSLREEADRAITATVGQLRAAGTSWSVIGDQLGMTRQGAHRRYGDSGTAIPRGQAALFGDGHD